MIPSSFTLCINENLYSARVKVASEWEDDGNGGLVPSHLVCCCMPYFVHNKNGVRPHFSAYILCQC